MASHTEALRLTTNKALIQNQDATIMDDAFAVFI
jgi:hypothetical protein